jgi:preprotein translocase subunit YajC
MELQRGNWVRTESGQVGKVVHISRLTVFVAFEVAGNERVEAFLESQLTKVDRPER